jgi:hypothetical protein
MFVHENYFMNYKYNYLLHQIFFHVILFIHHLFSMNIFSHKTNWFSSHTFILSSKKHEIKIIPPKLSMTPP